MKSANEHVSSEHCFPYFQFKSQKYNFPDHKTLALLQELKKKNQQRTRLECCKHFFNCRHIVTQTFSVIFKSSKIISSRLLPDRKYQVRGCFQIAAKIFKVIS